MSYLKNEKSNEVSYNVLDYKHLVTGIGTPNEDWSGAFNHLSSRDNCTIIVPRGIYKVRKTITTSFGVKFKGDGTGSTIQLMVDNTTLFNCQRGPVLNGDRCVFEDLNVVGLGIESWQRGFDMKNWDITFNNVTISHFTKGCVIKGTLIRFFNCYVHNCGNGLRVEPQIVNGNDTFTSMLTINDCLIHYNEVGIWCNDEDSRNPLVGFYINRTAFEYNDMAFDLCAVLRCVIRDSWFEQNKSRPRTVAYGIILENNKFENHNGMTQKILFKEGIGSYGEGGFYETIGSTTTLKELKLQEYANSKLLLTKEHLLKIRNGKLLFNMDTVNTVPKGGIVSHTEVANKTFYIMLNADGSIMTTNIPNEMLEIVKFSKGVFKISFKGKYFPKPIINATCMPNIASTTTCVRTSIAASCTNTNNYNNFGAIDTIVVKGTDENNNPTDCKVSLSILHSEVK